MNKSLAAAFLLVFASFITMASWADSNAQPPKPVTLNISTDNAPISTVLAVISKETGTPIVYDDTVRDVIGASHVSFASLEATFTFLKSKDPGLTAVRLYVPADKPIPTGQTLQLQVAALKQIDATGLVVVGGQSEDTLTFQRAKAPQATPAGMQLVYLVTNESVRTRMIAEQRIQEQQALNLNSTTGTNSAQSSPALPTASGLNSVGTSTMTPDQIAAQQAAVVAQWRAQYEQRQAARRAQLLQQQPPQQQGPPASAPAAGN